MAGIVYWATAGALAALVVAVLLRALLRERTDTLADRPDMAIYKDQLAEIARDQARGTLAEDEAARLRSEIGRRVLEADRAATPRPTGPVAGLPRMAAALVALVVPGALAAYWHLGAPGYPDMALEPRLAALDAAMADRPSQEAALDGLGVVRDAALDASLQADLAGLTDPAALRDRFRNDLAAGRTQAAIRVQERLLALLGDASDSQDHANLAFALVVEAEGYVSPEAETALRDSLTRDMGNELARYLVGELFVQAGRYDKAFQFWRPIAESDGKDAPWVSSVRDRIEDVAAMAGLRYSLPETTSPGPSAEDMAAAAEMSPEDRQAMIEDMVAQLSDRLARDGGPVEDWARLITSLAVLGQMEKAQSIHDEAKTRFAGRAADLATLRDAATAAGLTP